MVRFQPSRFNCCYNVDRIPRECIEIISGITKAWSQMLNITFNFPQDVTPNLSSGPESFADMHYTGWIVEIQGDSQLLILNLPR